MPSAEAQLWGCKIAQALPEQDYACMPAMTASMGAKEYAEANWWHGSFPHIAFMSLQGVVLEAFLLSSFVGIHDSTCVPTLRSVRRNSLHTQGISIRNTSSMGPPASTVSLLSSRSEAARSSVVLGHNITPGRLPPSGTAQRIPLSPATGRMPRTP